MHPSKSIDVSRPLTNRIFADARSSGVALLCALTLLSGCSSDSAPARSTEPRHEDAGRTADAATRTEGGRTNGVTAAPDGKPWSTLAEWHLFQDPVKQTPMDRVVPYDVNSELFADYAQKRRFIYVPEGAGIRYEATAHWGFPVGTILVKTFSYLADARDPSSSERLLETRLMVHEAGGWVPRTYVWDAEQTEAKLVVVGAVLQSHFIDRDGRDTTNGYVVPSGSECRQCHGKLGETDTLGGRTRQLDRDRDFGSGPENQIDHLATLGFFSGEPEPAATRERLLNPFDSAVPITERVRSYFDGNCGHCHHPGDAPGSASGLWLDYASTGPGQPELQWGRCKQPTSAGRATCGRAQDVTPGQPDLSIMLCRLESTAGNVRMPPLGRNLVHTEGVALIREWMTGLPGSCGTARPDAGSQTDSGNPDGAPTDSGSARDATDGGG